MKILYCEQPLNSLESFTFQDHDTASNKGVEGPVVTLLADSSLSRNKLPLFMPPSHEKDMLAIAPAIKIGRLGRFIAPRFAPRYYNAISLMARLVPASGLTTPASATLTSFDSAAVVGEWTPLDAESIGQSIPLDVKINEMPSFHETLSIDSINNLVAWLSSFFTLRNGDIIIPGIISVVPTPLPDSYFTVSLNDNDCLQFKIK